MSIGYLFDRGGSTVVIYSLESYDLLEYIIGICAINCFLIIRYHPTWQSLLRAGWKSLNYWAHEFTVVWCVGKVLCEPFSERNRVWWVSALMKRVFYWELTKVDGITLLNLGISSPSEIDDSWSSWFSMYDVWECNWNAIHAYGDCYEFQKDINCCWMLVCECPHSVLKLYNRDGRYILSENLLLARRRKAVLLSRFARKSDCRHLYSVVIALHTPIRTHATNAPSLMRHGATKHQDYVQKMGQRQPAQQGPLFSHYDPRYWHQWGSLDKKSQRRLQRQLSRSY